MPEDHRDIHSEVMLFDLAAGAGQVLLSSAEPIEAPNWTRDGASLIVNSRGRLYRIPLNQPALVPVDTGFAVSCNNDHGVSPDGRRLAISDKTEFGRSAIYTLPIHGGEPQPVVTEYPAYWHGWSPDGARLAYVSNRGEGFCVYTCDVDGGGERQITRGFDHCDGPDYTPDGHWIWFNGEINGAVDLYRVHPDGSGLECMTRDDAVNWFPHPSPDGASVLYLAYPPGTLGHPFGKQVSLRLLSAQGGTPRELIQLFGGQGTINVPCWAPDSLRFAFVRYRQSHGSRHPD